MTVEVPAVVGVPEMVPVVLLIERPAGRFAAAHEVIVAVDDESVAESASAVTADPDVDACAA